MDNAPRVRVVDVLAALVLLALAAGSVFAFGYLAGVRIGGAA